MASTPGQPTERTPTSGREMYVGFGLVLRTGDAEEGILATAMDMFGRKEKRFGFITSLLSYSVNLWGSASPGIVVIRQRVLIRGILLRVRVEIILETNGTEIVVNGSANFASVLLSGLLRRKHRPYEVEKFRWRKGFPQELEGEGDRKRVYFRIAGSDNPSLFVIGKNLPPIAIWKPDIDQH